MAYRIDVTVLDLAQVFGGAIPTVTGTLTGAFPGTTTKLAPDPAVSIPGAAPTSVLFAAALSGGLPASVVLNDTKAPTGQLFRSGEVTLPPSPGQVTLYTAVGAIGQNELTAFGASLTGTELSTPIAEWAKLLLGAFGYIPPEAITITSATISPVAATPGAPGSLSITVTGSFTYRFLFFIPVTQTFTIRTAIAIAPSGDGIRTDRIVSVVPSATTLMVPGVTMVPVPFNVINGTLTDRLEPVINRAIVNAVDAKLRARTPPMRRTPTCVISARMVGTTGSGITAQIMLADFGPAVVALPRTLALSVMPAPVPNVERTYTFRVVDRADQSPVGGATVALTNRNPTTTQTGLTDGQGEAKFTVTLRTQTIGGGAHLDGEPPVLQPYAVASAPGAPATTLLLSLVEPV